MGYRVVFTNSLQVECDTPNEALELVGAMVKAAGLAEPQLQNLQVELRKELRDSHETAAAVLDQPRRSQAEPEARPAGIAEQPADTLPEKPSSARQVSLTNGPRNKRLKERREAAAAFLLQRGEPAHIKEIAEACGLDVDTIVPLLAHPLFSRQPDGRVWLTTSNHKPKTEVKLPTSTELRDAAAGTRTNLRNETYRKLIRRKLEAVGKPLSVAALAAAIGATNKDIQSVLTTDAFDRTARGIWLPGVPLPGSSVEDCREKIYTLLTNSEKQMMKPAFISESINEPYEVVVEAIKHEWFQADHEGYRVARSGPAAITVSQPALLGD